MNNIRQKLSLASSVLLGITAPAIAETEPWVIDFGVMTYKEQDRNTGFELIAKGSRETADAGLVTLEANLDVITGASPIGASSTNVPQTFTQASGVGSYTVAANELPADDTHMDTRLGLSIRRNDPLSSNLAANYNGAISMEFDYFSISSGGELAWDINDKNTTLAAGANLEFNSVHPVGNIPIPLATQKPAGDRQPRGKSTDYKTGNELFFGLNQIINQNSLFQIRLNSSKFSGYLTDGYKILSVIDDKNEGSLGATQRNIFENRPEKRKMSSIYLAYKHALPTGIFDLSYRFYDDDWDIQSHTTEVAFQHTLKDNLFFKPTLRAYQQSAASFYFHSLPGSEAIPAFASADYRLAEFDAYTLSLEFGKKFSFNRKQSLMLQYYAQRGESHPSNAIGLQKQQDLFPDLNALILTYIYSIKW